MNMNKTITLTFNPYLAALGLVAVSSAFYLIQHSTLNASHQPAQKPISIQAYGKTLNEAEILQDKTLLEQHYQSELSMTEDINNTLKDKMWDLAVEHRAHEQGKTVSDICAEWILETLQHANPQTLYTTVMAESSDNAEEIQSVVDTIIKLFSKENNIEDQDYLTQYLAGEIMQSALFYAKDTILNQLIQQSVITVQYRPKPRYPEALRVKVPEQGGISQNNGKAPVTIAEVSDLTCHFCAKSEQDLKQIQESFPDSVRRVVYLVADDDIESKSHQLAEASYCANDQQQFWGFHDAIYAAEDPEKIDLTALAQSQKLNMDQFNTCRNEHHHHDDILKNIEMTKTMDLHAVPVFFINGRRLDGRLHYEEAAELIKEELQETTI